MKKAFIWSNGCERRLLDAKRFSDYLIKNGYKIVRKPKNADLIVFFACSFIDKLTNESLNKISEFQKKYSNAELLVAGCLPAIDGEKLDNIYSGKKIFTTDLNMNMNRIDELFPENKVEFNEIMDANIYELPIKNPFRIFVNIKKYFYRSLFNYHSLLYSPLYEKSFYIRISWGCPNNCTYCGIKKAVGPLMSKSIGQCMEEFKRGLAEGYNNFIICGDDTASYGLDIGSSLLELLDKMTGFPDKYHLAIRDLNPYWLVKNIDGFEDVLRRNKINYLDVPIQSGTPRILKLMKRYSNTKLMKEAFMRVKKVAPNIVINTHYILGFPSETEEEFKQTLAFIKEISFDNIIVIPFSPKKGTKAEEFEPKVSADDIQKRIAYTKEYFKKAGYHIRIKTPADNILIGKRVLSFN